jgi:hypothetical protein
MGNGREAEQRGPGLLQRAIRVKGDKRMTRRKLIVREIPTPTSAIELAQKRTEFLFRCMAYGDTSMPMILASAYIQGMNDMFDALERRGLIADLEEPQQ